MLIYGTKLTTVGAFMNRRALCAVCLWLDVGCVAGVS